MLQAQPYPSHPIQIVVPNGPSSVGDTAARSVTDELGKILKTPVIIVTKPDHKNFATPTFHLKGEGEPTGGV